jgi:Putative transposase
MGRCAQERIEVTDHVGLERLLRYCVRPIFAGERLAWVEAGERLVYYLPKPRANGQTILSLTPLELLNRLAPLNGAAVGATGGRRPIQGRMHRSRRPGVTGTVIMASWPRMPHCVPR